MALGGLGAGSELVFYTSATHGVLNAEYLNSTRPGVGWSTNATDLYSAPYFAAHFPNASACYQCNMQSRRGLNASAAAAVRGVKWTPYSIVELWNSAQPGTGAYSGQYFAELCSDQARSGRPCRAGLTPPAPIAFHRAGRDTV